MKKGIVLAVAAIFAAPAVNAQTTFQLSMEFAGGLQALNGSYTTAEIDLVQGPRYFTVNGSFGTADGLASPATGTCFYTSSSGIYCNVQIDHLSVNMAIEASLSGTATMKGGDGATLSTTPVTITAVN